IQVIGPLAHRFSWWSWGYRELAGKIKAALNDPAVHAILLDTETPGGTVAGLFDFARFVKKASETKPIYTLINDMACSAGMAIASQTNKRFITQNGIAGSVGVVMMHLNQGPWMDKIGLEATLIYSGDHKVDGNPYAALPDDVRQGYQAECDQLRLEFAELVASNMNLSVEQILATEAQTYRGQEAIDIGFADQLVNSYEIINVINDSNQTAHLNFIGTSMENQNSTTVAATGGAPAVAASAKLQEQVAATKQQQEASATVATVTAIAAGGVSVDAAQMERERIQAIVTSAQGKAQPALAEHFAYNTGMSADDAIKALDAAAKDKPQTDASDKSGVNSGFEAAMGKDNPNIGADTTELTGDDKVIAESLALYNGGFKS
ncbi:MAG: S49 family peptidase, partial [Shewanella sp.]